MVVEGQLMSYVGDSVLLCMSFAPLACLAFFVCQKPVMRSGVANVLILAWCMWWLFCVCDTVCVVGLGICIIVLGQPCQHGVQPQRQTCTNMGVLLIVPPVNRIAL